MPTGVRALWKLAFNLLLLILDKNKLFFTKSFLFNDKNTAIKENEK